MPKGVPKAPAPVQRKRREPLDDDTLFAFVTNYQERNKDWPTLRVCADHFSTTLTAIENAVSMFEINEGRGVDLIVGYRAGSGIAEIKERGAYKVEAWDDGDEET